jgi:hypothetical protein
VPGSTGNCCIPPWLSQRQLLTLFQQAIYPDNVIHLNAVTEDKKKS